MKTKEQIDKSISEIQDLNNKIIEAKELLDIALDDLARDSCPLKIGDKVKILGWSHRGKKGIVEKIHRGHPLHDYESSNWRVSGSVFKKDGIKGKFGFVFGENDYKRDQLKLEKLQQLEKQNEN